MKKATVRMTERPHSHLYLLQAYTKSLSLARSVSPPHSSIGSVQKDHRMSSFHFLIREERAESAYHLALLKLNV